MATLDEIKPDFEKFKALVLYVCAKSQEYHDFGATKLNKILYYSDFIGYLYTGRPITGETYVKRQWGPVPKRVLEAQNELVAEKKLVVRDVPFAPRTKREFIVLTAPDVSQFTPEEISLVDDCIEQINRNFSAGSISKLSHDQIWEIWNIGDELPYPTIMASYAGEIDEQDIAWAQGRA